MSDEPTIRYGDGEFEGMTFVRRCSKCSRFVKADDVIKINFEGQPIADNATCARCGRTSMLFVGYL